MGVFCSLDHLALLGLCVALIRSILLSLFIPFGALYLIEFVGLLDSLGLLGLLMQYGSLVVG